MFLLKCVNVSQHHCCHVVTTPAVWLGTKLQQFWFYQHKLNYKRPLNSRPLKLYEIPPRVKTGCLMSWNKKSWRPFSCVNFLFVRDFRFQYNFYWLIWKFEGLYFSLACGLLTSKAFESRLISVAPNFISQ